MGGEEGLSCTMGEHIFGRSNLGRFGKVYTFLNLTEAVIVRLIQCRGYS